MENKYRKILQRAFKVISPDFDPSSWSDQEFQSVFVNDVNFLIDHMVRRSKYIEEIKAKTITKAEMKYEQTLQVNENFYNAQIDGKTEIAMPVDINQELLGK